jgi:hypothetical protein
MDEEQLSEIIYPVEFITTTQKIGQTTDSILLTTIEYLLSLNWPICPRPPPAIDIGTSMENFLTNIINKNKLNIQNETLDSRCKLPENFEQPLKKTLDYNEFLKSLQTVLEQSKTASDKVVDGKTPQNI